MGKIFYLMGKSSSGKDTIYKHILTENKFKLRKIVPYTTRPIREGEEDGREYFFIDDAEVRKLADEGRIIELRAYKTYHGNWKYMTINDGRINLKKHNYLIIGTLESYKKTVEYFGQEAVVPILIREARNKHFNDYVCPRCNNEVVYKQNYCSECGVKFMWEGQ